MSNNQPRGPRRMHGGAMGTEKAKNFKGTIRQMMSYIGHYKIGLIFVALFAVGSTIFNVAGPKILGKATTELSEGLMRKIQGNGGIDFSKIGWILVSVLCLYGCSAILNALQGWIMTGITQKICYRLRKEISEKINRMPMKYFESRTYGEVLSRITNDVDSVGMGLNQSVTQIITSVTTLIGVFIMMLSISPLMTLIAFVILPISVALISLVVKKSQKYFKTQQEYLGHINGQIEENYGGHNVVRAFNKEESAVKSFLETNDVLYDSAWKSQFLSGMMQPIMMFVGNLGYAGVAIAGGFLTINGTIQVGDIQAFIQYVKNFTQPIQQIAQVINQVQSMTAASERVFEFLEEENGNPFRLCIRLLKDWIKTGSERITFQIHRNLLADLSVTGQNQMFGIRGFLMKDELYKSFVEELYNRLDKDRYPTTIETLCYIVDMAIMILIKSMAMYYQNPSEKETIIQVLTEEMTILERGMCTQTSQQS